MKVVERYILRRAFGVFAAALFWVLAIVWTTQVLARINLVTDSGQSAFAFFELATLILPSIIPIVVPFAVAIGVAQTLSMMNSDSELVVINAAGSSRLATVRPVLALAVCASIFSFAIDNGVDPYSRLRLRQLLSTANADLLSSVIQEGSFRKVEEGLFVHIGDRLPDGRLGGIFLADSRVSGTDLTYYAKQGQVVRGDDKNVLMMEDGVVHRKSADGEVSAIKFTSYAFDLSMFTPGAGVVGLYPKDRTLSYLLSPDPNDRVFQQTPQLLRAELHQRLSEWLYPLAFALIALAVAGDARSHREARIHPLITALTIVLLIRWVGFFAANKSQNDPLYNLLVYGAPIGSGLLASWFILTNRTMELPIAWTERATVFAKRISDRLVFLRAGASAKGEA